MNRLIALIVHTHIHTAQYTHTHKCTHIHTAQYTHTQMHTQRVGGVGGEKSPCQGIDLMHL